MKESPDISALVRRYLDLWQQHLTQTANDPDLAAERMMDSFRWFGASGQIADADGSTSSAPPPDGGRDDLRKLARRVAALERRLAAVEGQAGGDRRDAAEGSGEREP